MKGTRVRLSAEERRETIVRAARYLFLRHGFHGATTRAIARQAGVTEAILYQYFPSKDALFEETVVRPASANAESLLARMSALTEASRAQDPAALRGAQRELLEEVTRLVPGIGALFYSDPEVGRQLYRQLMVPVFERHVAELAGGSGTGGVDPDRMRNFLTLSYGAALGGALHQHFAAEPKDASEFSEHLAALIENGTEGRRQA
jgi:AcrR family transcriptional regulator